MSTNVFESIIEFGHDEAFEPDWNNEFPSTDAPAGSEEKIEILARRLERGVPLWHPEDRCDYTNLTGAIRPRESN